MWKLATVNVGDTKRVALVLGDRLANVDRLGATRNLRGRGAPITMLEVLAAWKDWHPLLAESATQLERATPTADDGTVADSTWLPADAPLCAPILYPGKLLCAMGNYAKHVREMAGPSADIYKQESGPLYFMKPSSSTVVGPTDTIIHPKGTQQVDWEIELAVVIGARAKNVLASEAAAYVAGYTILNDITARDRLVRPDLPSIINRDWLTGKGFDTFAPMGPYLVPASEIADPHALKISLSVNGTVHQDSTTADMIFNIYEQIEHITRVMTLEPGDVISTGTPDGVGFMKGIFLKPGDLVVGEIEHLGQLRNLVVAAP